MYMYLVAQPTNTSHNAFADTTCLKTVHLQWTICNEDPLIRYINYKCIHTSSHVGKGNVCPRYLRPVKSCLCIIDKVHI